MKYIFIDIDGTLLSHEDGNIPRTAINAIKQARQRSHKVFICSGRAASEVDPIIRSIGFDGYIFACGSHVEIEGITLSKNILDIKTLRPILATINHTEVGYKLDGMHACYLSDFTYSFFFDLFMKEQQNDKKKTLAYMHLIKMYRTTTIKQNTLVKACLFAKQFSSLIDIKAQLDTSYTCILQKNENGISHLEICNKNISKATGVKTILEHFHASINDSIAIGDSMNDIEMLQFCHIGIAMGNANTEVKQIADIVCEHIDNNGLKDAFTKVNIL
ncbi:MAG: Cof-type HAD-IIB family hydrolase [Breznakia sp.]